MLPCKLKFPCKLCEGDHLTYKCPSIAEVRRVWIHGHPIFEHYGVSQKPASLNEVGPSHLASVVHAGGKLLASAGHAKRKQSATASHVDIVEKTGRLKCKLKFPCILCEGDHLTHLCPAIPEVRRVWSKTQGFPSPEQPIVSQKPTQPLVDQVVEPISDLVDPTLL